jgi:hypothetical protein
MILQKKACKKSTHRYRLENCSNISIILIFRFKDIASDKGSNDDRSARDCIYKKFLIGSKVCEKLDVPDYERLEILADVALTYPMSLQSLTHINCASFYHYDEDEHEIEVLLDMHFKVYKSTLIYNIKFMQSFLPVLLRAGDLLP